MLACTIGGFDVAVVDDERDRVMMRSKVIINIHTNEDSSLEVHRINYLLSIGKIVVSERSLNDQELDSVYEDVVIFLNSNDIASEVFAITNWLLTDDEYRLKLEQRAYRRYHDVIKHQLSTLDYAIEQALMAE